MKNILSILLLFSFNQMCTERPVSYKDYKILSTDYSCKTYVYLGNTFAEKHQGIIDTSNYSFEEFYKNGKLLSQFYPTFGGNASREINYSYHVNGSIKSKISTVEYKTGATQIDSIIHKELDDKTTEITTYNFRAKPQLEILRKSGDTLFTDITQNDKVLYTHREYWESPTLKQSCQIFPKDTKQINKYLYDEHGELVQMDRYQDNKLLETSLRLELHYDDQNRVIKRISWAGEEKMLSSIEFMIYEESIQE